MLPQEIINWFTSIFADVNRRLSEKILNVPAIPEPHLDTTFIEHLMGFATPRMFKGDWAVRIDTHFIGGLAQWRRWEIADIGLFVFFQRRGELVRQKVALLQSKRLYPVTGAVMELDEFDYMIGMARLGERDAHQATILASRKFEFARSSSYQALNPADDQTKHIREFLSQRDIPIFYLLYNPPRVPLRIAVPLIKQKKLGRPPALGARIVAAPKVLNLLDAVGRPPTLKQLDDFLDHSDPTVHVGGWRLEYFLTELLLGCLEGRRFTSSDDRDLFEIFNRRSGPIAATVAVTVQMPGEAELPD